MAQSSWTGESAGPRALRCGVRGADEQRFSCQWFRQCS
jgi:hypothetical protein